VLKSTPYGSYIKQALQKVVDIVPTFPDAASPQAIKTLENNSRIVISLLGSP